MADSTLFEVDAALIIAKLHLAGILATTIGPESFIVNTGIKNDNPKAKPDDPGNVTFDLKNSSSEYEVGYVTWFEYKNLDVLKSLAKDAITKMQSTMKEISGPDSKIDISSTDPKVKKALAEIENLKKMVKELLDNGSLALETEEDIKKALEEIDKLDTKKAFELASKKKQKEAVDALTSYMVNFAGKDAIDTAMILNPAVVQVPEKAKDSNDKSLVKNFEIMKADQAEIDRLNLLFKSLVEKNPKDMMYKQHVCFKVKYSLNVDK